MRGRQLEGFNMFVHGVSRCHRNSAVSSNAHLFSLLPNPLPLRKVYRVFAAPSYENGPVRCHRHSSWTNFPADSVQFNQLHGPVVDKDVGRAGIVDFKRRVKRPQVGPAGVNIICFSRHFHLPWPCQTAEGLAAADKLFTGRDLLMLSFLCMATLPTQDRQRFYAFDRCPCKAPFGPRGQALM